VRSRGKGGRRSSLLLLLLRSLSVALTFFLSGHQGLRQSALQSKDLDNFVMSDDIDGVSDFNRSIPLAGLGHLGHHVDGTDSFVYLARI
jgi:hypothetical protein